jgi:predicted DNA repair protein MutK
MPGASLFTLLDDIASVLDDVATMTKVAARKTAGVLGDDLALNAQQVAGVRAERELPVVWAVAAGSFRNKLILVPAALALSALAPWAITPLLVIGGAYLCFEGVEKIAHRWLHSPAEDAARHAAVSAVLDDAAQDIVAFERERIAAAVRTDFILSAEIIVISLGTVQTMPLQTRFGVLAAVALLMTVGVYGLVALIVKMDDAGLWLMRRAGNGIVASLQHSLGETLLAVAPRMLKLLAVAGTLAMFLVGGGIVVHGIPVISAASAALAQTAGAASATAGAVVPILFDAVAGVLTGALVLGVVLAVSRLRQTVRAA